MDKEVGITRAGYHKGMGITRRWEGGKEVGITKAGYHKQVEGVDKQVGIPRVGYHKEVGITSTVVLVVL